MSETHRVGSEPKESWPEEANLGGWKFLNADWPKKRRPECEFYCHRKFNWWNTRLLSLAEYF